MIKPFVGTNKHINQLNLNLMYYIKLTSKSNKRDNSKLISAKEVITAFNDLKNNSVMNEFYKCIEIYKVNEDLPKRIYLYK